MGSNGTLNFTWTASFDNNFAYTLCSFCSNGTLNFTWTASIIQNAMC